jgi:putative flippase GtrA
MKIQNFFSFRDSIYFRYLVVGVFNTIAGNLVFLALWTLLGTYISYTLTSAISFLISVFISFCTQALIVFRTHDRRLHRLTKFYLSQSLNLVIFMGALLTLRKHLHLGPYLSYFSGSLIVITISFILNRRWVFTTQAAHR